MAIKPKKKKAAFHKTQPDSLVQFRQRLFGGKKVNPKEVFRDLHAFRDFREMSAVAQYVASPNNPFHHFIFGIPFAKSYHEVRSTRFLSFTNDLQKDLDWMSLSVLRYSKEISLFVKQTVSFQNAFLLGNYEQATAILESITTNYGPSLWVLEKSFLLSEYAQGLESNKKLQTNIIEDEKNDALLKFIAGYMSLRCEAKLSDENYRMRLSRALEFDDKYSSLKNYLRYRLEHVGIDLIPVVPDVIFFEGASPVVDRYLTFIAILQSCAVAGNEYFGIAKNVILRVEGLIQDSRIDALLQFIIPERKLEWNALDSKVLDILDNYTNGYYERSAAETANILIENPDIYELYYIYIRSLDHMVKPFSQIFPKDTLAASILEHSNVIIRGEKASHGSSDYLSKVATTLWRDPMAYGLYDFYQEETLPISDKRFHKLSLLNSSHINPRFAAIYENIDMADQFLNQLSSSAGESSTLSLMRAITATAKTCDNYEFSLLIPETRRRIYSAEMHEAAARPQRAISVLNPLLKSLESNNLPGGFYTLERVTRALFRCYLDIKALPECTDLVVRSYLRNDLLTRKLPLMQLIKTIDETSQPDVIRRITYPILYSMIYTKARSIYVSYDNFMSTLGISRPTQLFELAEQFNPRELNEFLNKVCTIDVLACSYHFKGTKDLETERIHICQFLSERDQTNSKVYSDEISTITSRSLIREGMRQIDVSKIYVNEQGIRTTGRKILEESFLRYRELASMSSIETMQMLNPESLSFYILTSDGQTMEKVSLEDLNLNDVNIPIVRKSLLLIVKELFIDVRDRFISSGDHGLDGYLSVRVRHGVLQNQIRSPFEALHLISEKDTTTGEYLSNPYWDTRLEDVSKESCLEIQNLLSTFSRQVDEVAQKLNKELIQVRTEKKNNDGLFDYRFNTVELFNIFQNEFIHITDFDQFLDNVFRVLWKRTEENLERIRRIISEDLKDTLYASISQLEREIRNIVAPSHAAELLKNIARCQTSLQYTLESVAQWFTISTSSLIPQFNLDDLVNICIQSINNIYPHKKVYPVTKIDGNVVIDGVFFAPFFDIVRTLLDNALVHSGLLPENMDVEIEIKITDGTLAIMIKNGLGKEVRQSDPVNALKGVHSSIKTSEIMKVIAKEGRSGLMKVRKIMAVDLRRKNSSLDFSYDEHGRFVVVLEMEMEGLSK